MYSGTVIRSESFDPQYRVKFTYSIDKAYIRDGVAIFLRKAPVPEVSFDDYTDYMIEKLGLDEDALRNIRLEVGKTVCDYIFSTMELKSF